MHSDKDLIGLSRICIAYRGSGLISATEHRFYNLIGSIKTTHKTVWIWSIYTYRCIRKIVVCWWFAINCLIEIKCALIEFQHEVLGKESELRSALWCKLGWRNWESAYTKETRLFVELRQIGLLRPSEYCWLICKFIKISIAENSEN